MTNEHQKCLLSTLLSLRLSLKLLVVSAVVQALDQNLETGGLGANFILFYLLYNLIQFIFSKYFIMHINKVHPLNSNAQSSYNISNFYV